MALGELPLEMLTHVRQHLGLRDSVRVSATCKRFRHGGLETVELPTESPVVTALHQHAFPRPKLIPSMRSISCLESWVAYLDRCARQRRCREAPFIAAGWEHTLFVDAAGRLLASGIGVAVGRGHEDATYPVPTPVAALAGLRIRSVVAELDQSLALSWDGRVYSWGDNFHGQLGHGDKLTRPSPVLVEGLERVSSIAAQIVRSLAVTLSGDIFCWGKSFVPGAEDSLRPVIVEGFGGVRVRRVCAGYGSECVYAIGEGGRLFPWGLGDRWLLGHGDGQNLPLPKQVEALRGVWVNSVAVACCHALALAEDGLVYAWGGSTLKALLGHPLVKRRRLPTPVEALRGVRVGSIAAAEGRSYAVADSGEVWAWGLNGDTFVLGHGDEETCPLPKLIESLRGIKVDAVAAGDLLALARADDGSVYAWGDGCALQKGALGLGLSVSDAVEDVPTPQRIPGLRVACDV
jgi:alpha-tubulin suppressor-like RCC1 family protein